MDNQSLRKINIIIVNVIIMAVILIFVVLYSWIKNRDSYFRQIDYFENTTVTMDAEALKSLTLLTPQQVSICGLLLRRSRNSWATDV